MRVLVTGGAGFIGSHLCRLLSADPSHRVVALDNLSIGLSSNLEGLPADLIVGSLLDPTALKEAMDGTDSVVHLAALPSVPRSLADPMASHEANATGTLRVLQAAQSAGVRHVTVISSSSVYGNNASPVKHEDLPTRPRSPYAASKLASEAYALAFGDSFDMNVIVFRLFNVFGPYQRGDHPYAAVIPRFALAALTGQTLEVHGSGEQSRDFTYVGDVVEVLRAATLGQVRSAVPVNLAFGGNISLNQVISAIEGRTGRAVTIRTMPERAGDVSRSMADSSRMRALFPDVRQTPFDVAIAQTLDWYKSQEA
jgi:UDP-glucose 4-epimerase